MNFSVTELQTGMRCPQKWQLTSFNRAGLEPIVKSPALNLGTLIHKTKEDWATRKYILGEVDVDPVKIYIDHRSAMIADTVLTYRQNIGVSPGGAEMAALTQAGMLGESMIRNYVDYWGTPIHDSMQLIKAEQVCIAPIPGTEHCACEDRYNCPCGPCRDWDNRQDRCFCLNVMSETCRCIEYHYLEGTLDGLMVHMDTGIYYILENKTFASHPTTQELQRNFQFLCYIWLARNFFQSDVRGIAYDGLWKRAQVPMNPPKKDGTQTPKHSQSRGRPYELGDLFLRVTLVRSLNELERLPYMLALAANRLANYPTATAVRPGGPELFVPERFVPPVKGCVLDDKENIMLCDALWRGEDVSGILRHYRKRERTQVWDDAHEDDE